MDADIFNVPVTFELINRRIW